MRIDPLPVRTRLFHREQVSSYSSRHARNNGAQAQEIERAVNQQQNGPPIPHRTDDPAKKQLWRDLGRLDPRAFTAPRTVSGVEVPVVRLCARCTAGAGIWGMTPDRGSVCLKHRLWLGATHVDIRHWPGLLTAERRLRSCLVPRGIQPGSPLLEAAYECARAGLLLHSMESRRNRAPLDDVHLITYPETVNIARHLSSPNIQARDGAGRPRTELGRARLAEEILNVLVRTEGTIPTGARVARIHGVLRYLDSIDLRWRIIDQTRLDGH